MFLEDAFSFVKGRVLSLGLKTAFSRGRSQALEVHTMQGERQGRRGEAILAGVSLALGFRRCIASAAYDWQLMIRNLLNKQRCT